MPSSPSSQLDPIQDLVEDNHTPAATDLVTDVASNQPTSTHCDQNRSANDEEQSANYSDASNKNAVCVEKDSKQDNIDAQNPNFKVKMTSPSPDVVIATVEPDTDNPPDDHSSDDKAHSAFDASLNKDTSATERFDTDKVDSTSTIIEDIEAAIIEGETLSDSETLADEPKIILSSPSPNVVIATIEPEADALESTNQHDSSVEDIEGLPSETDSVNNLSVDNPSITDDSVTGNSAPDQGTLPIVNDDQQLNIEQNLNYSAEEKQQEEIKEVKEAKLESYKQFIAKQFSNQEINYPEVRITIEANALPSKMYFIMNILSAIIASYGLVINSAAVVIGAMLVAMMLGPITGIALAIIDYRMPLLRKSLITVSIGISLVVLVGFVVGWLHKNQPLTAEILSRTQPTSMDLMIALAGGTAGAYAMVSPHLSVAVVGVAVATALVPPLAASGILFANGELQLGLGALLLAITNIIAIQFTNAMVLWFLGFRRLVDDDYKTNTFFTFLRRNAVTLLLLIGLGSYLSINLNKNARQQTFESNVKETINSYFSDKGNVLTNTQFDTTGDNKIVRAIIRGETTPSSYDVQQIEAIITEDMAANYPKYLPIKVQLRYLPVQVIEANPLSTDKLDKTDAAILTN